MNLLKLTKNLLKMSLKAFLLCAYLIFDSPSEKMQKISSKYASIKNIAMSCGIYPITYPYIYQTPTHFISKLLTLNLLFRFLTYRNINKKIKNNKSIFVKTDELIYFEDVVLQKINIPFILVTGDSDYGIKKHINILKNKFLIHWFAQNNDVQDKNVTILPIGINYSTLLFEDSMGEKKQTAPEQEKRLLGVKNLKEKKRLKVFANFHLNITSKKRKKLYYLLRSNPNMFFQAKRIPRTDVWKQQNRYAFCFSPVGNGLDCHRTWESLVLGQIPIVEKTNTPLDDLHRQFPIVIIENLSEITGDNLKKWYKKYSKMFTSGVKHKLTNKYWIEKIGK